MANYDKYTLIWPQDLTGKTLEMSYLVSGKRYQEVDVIVDKYTYNATGGTYYVEFTNNLKDVTASGDKSFDYNKEGSHYVYVGRGKVVTRLREFLPISIILNTIIKHLSLTRNPSS